MKDLNQIFEQAQKMQAKVAELQASLDEAEIERRRSQWIRPDPRESRGVLAKYARIVRCASEGATTG